MQLAHVVKDESCLHGHNCVRLASLSVIRAESVEINFRD